MDQRLITVDELRAAGALDVPPAWRKSLGNEPKRNQGLLPGFENEDESDSQPEDCAAEADEQSEN